MQSQQFSKVNSSILVIEKRVPEWDYLVLEPVWECGGFTKKAILGDKSTFEVFGENPSINLGVVLLELKELFPKAQIWCF